MKLTFGDLDCIRLSVEGFLYGMISILLFSGGMPQVTKAVQHYTILGLYSGILIMHLQYTASKKDFNERNNILLYALCLLYVLSLATLVLDVGIFFSKSVSKNEYPI